MGLSLLCVTILGLWLGAVLIFSGYRFFLFLLPIWGFIFGFGFGAQFIAAIFSTGVLATLTGWIAGFIVGAIFAVLSYLFYMFAVGIISGSFGYGLVVGLLTWIGLDFGFLVWALGLAGAAVAIFVVIRFNLAKYAIILVTALGGTGIVIYTLLAVFGDLTPIELMLNPVAAALEDSFWWTLFALVLVVAGVVAQLRTSQGFEVEEYNRLSVDWG
jgi:hypothetical protein